MSDIEAAEFADYLRDERERSRGRDLPNRAGGMYWRAMMRAHAESIGVDRDPAPPRRAEPDLDIPAPVVDEPPMTVSAALAEAAFAPPPASAIPPDRPRATTAYPNRHMVGAAALTLFVVAGGVIWSLIPRSAPGTPQPAIGSTPPSAGAALAAAASPQLRAASPQPAAGAPQLAARRQVAPRSATRAAAPQRGAGVEGTLSVTSQPPGARVTVNGIGWGQTPVTIRHLDLGPKRIRVTMQGYVSEERVAHLTPGEPTAAARVVMRRRSPAPPVASSSR